MRSFLLAISFLSYAIVRSQVPFISDQDRLMVFARDRILKLEPRPPRRTFPLEDQLVYEDHEGRLKVFMADEPELFLLQENGAGLISASREKLAWLSGDTLKVLEGRSAKPIAFEVDTFSVSDQLIVFRSGDQVRTSWNGRIHDLFQVNESDPSWIHGKNTVLFSDQGHLRLFHEGEIITLSDQADLSLAATGNDIAAWWQADRGTLVWQKGSIHEISALRPIEVQCGNSIAAFTVPDLGLMCFREGELHNVIPEIPSIFKVKDDLLVFLHEGKLELFGPVGRVLVEPYVPEWWDMNGDLLVYLDIDREVRGIQGGERLRFGKETNSRDPELIGKTVIYTSPTGHATIIHEGRTYVF